MMAATDPSPASSSSTAPSDDEPVRWTGYDFYNFEIWYPALEHLTFRTTYVPLSVAEAWALKKYHELTQFLLLYREVTKDDASAMTKETGKLSPERLASGWRDEDFQWVEAQLEGRGNPDFALTPAERAPLETLTKKLERAIAELDFQEHGFFIKLSSRSPKDAALYMGQTGELLAKHIREEQQTEAMSEEQKKIADLIYFMRSITEVLHIHTAEMAVRLLLRSKRVADDIGAAEMNYHGQVAQPGDKIILPSAAASDGEEKDQAASSKTEAPSISEQHLADNSPFILHLVLREWCLELKPEWEFRCFVYGDNMTSITQYNTICYIPRMYELREQIADKILSFWRENVHQQVLQVARQYAEKQDQASDWTLPGYTVDFALSPELDKIWLIEINNPPPVAGTSLFKWKNPDDRRIIEQGPFEIRVRSSLRENALDKVFPPLRQRIDLERGRVSAPTTSSSSSPSSSSPSSSSSAPPPISEPAHSEPEAEPSTCQLL